VRLHPSEGETQGSRPGAARERWTPLVGAGITPKNVILSKEELKRRYHDDVTLLSA
jgi:hypothetical protein